MFVVCVLYAINYDINDIESYFLLAYVCVGLWAGVGLLVIGTWWMRAGGWPLPVVCCVDGERRVGAVRGALHGSWMSHPNHLVDDYTANMFASVQPGALVLSYQWDYWVSASYYVQEVRNERTDVLVIDKELLRRSWYLKELDGAGAGVHGAVCGGSGGVPEGGLSSSSTGSRTMGPVIEARFVGMIRAMIARGMEERPVYVTPEIEEQFTAGLVRVPEGLAFRVVADTLFHPTPLSGISGTGGWRGWGGWRT